MEEQRYFIRLAYDGTGFHGWQRQPNGITIQQTLEEAMSLIMRTPVVLTGAGRTDTGVHATEFYAHFDTHVVLNATDCNKLVFKLNAYLSGNIALYEIFRVTAGSHARFSAVSRTYRYCIATIHHPFRRHYTYFMYGAIDVERMNEGAALIMTYRDFTSFSKVDSDTKTNNCSITYAHWDFEGTELVFTITADRFLRNMVRAIVGTLLDLGRGKIAIEDIRRIIESKNRSYAGESVPAKGLVLHHIGYSENIRSDCRG